ncbi:MAG TPA: hypothetical protein VJ859_08470 [Allosphingosinicella sp.]|nr:hypothetical protein [Allosphingosinicella sp.]
MNKEKLSIGARLPERLEEAKEILRTLRKCRSRLNGLHLDHAAAYADIAVQLLKQSIASEETSPP